MTFWLWLYVMKQQFKYDWLSIAAKLSKWKLHKDIKFFFFAIIYTFKNVISTHTYIYQNYTSTSQNFRRLKQRDSGSTRLLSLDLQKQCVAYIINTFFFTKGEIQNRHLPFRGRPNRLKPLPVFLPISMWRSTL